MLHKLTILTFLIFISVNCYGSVIEFNETFDSGNLDNWVETHNEYNTGWDYTISNSKITVTDVMATQSMPYDTSTVSLTHNLNAQINGQFSLHWDLSFSEPLNNNSYALGMYIVIPKVALVQFNDTSSYTAAEMITSVYNPETLQNDQIIHNGYGSLGYSGNYSIDITRSEDGLVELFLNGNSTPFRTQTDNFETFDNIRLVFYRGLWSGGESFPYGEVSTDTINFSGVGESYNTGSIPEPASVLLLMIATIAGFIKKFQGR